MKIRSLLLSLLLAVTSVAFAQTTPIDDAKAALRKGDLPAAETLLAPLATGAAPDAAAVHQLGIVRQRQGRLVDALALLEQAAELDATKAEYFSVLGSAIGQRMSEVPMMEMARLSGKLRKTFAKSVEIDPNHLEGLIGLARYYASAPEMAGGSLEKAAEFAQRVQKLNPFLGAIELGIVAERAEDPAAALLHYESALRLKSDSPGALTASGRMLAKLGRKDEARARLESAIQLDPKRETARKALAELKGD